MAFFTYYERMDRDMYLKLLGCKMLEREIASVVYNSVNAVDVTMVRLQLHEKPKKLRGVLQEEIDAILLGFGLCSETVTVIF